MANADLGERASKARTFTPTPRYSGRTWLAVGGGVGRGGGCGGVGWRRRRAEREEEERRSGRASWSGPGRAWGEIERAGAGAVIFPSPATLAS